MSVHRTFLWEGIGETKIYDKSKFTLINHTILINTDIVNNYKTII